MLTGISGSKQVRRVSIIFAWSAEDTAASSPGPEIPPPRSVVRAFLEGSDGSIVTPSRLAAFPRLTLSLYFGEPPAGYATPAWRISPGPDTLAHQKTRRACQGPTRLSARPSEQVVETLE